MAQPASGKPSLIDDMPAAGGPGLESGESIRMLDALDSSQRPAPRAAARRGFGLLLAGIMLLAACGAGWSWWNQRNNVDDDPDRVTRIGTAPATAPVKPPPTTATATATLPPTVASAIGAAAAPAPGATIIAMPDAAAPAAVPSSAGSAAVSTPPAAASQPAPVAAGTRVAAAAPTKTKPKAATTAPETRLAADAKANRKRVATPPLTPNRRTTTATATATATATPTSTDPDVALLSAMLANMSRDGTTAPNSSPGAQTQLTIAQLVQRCNVRGVKDAIETFECRRRICDGYWGKAEACPMSLSPKKN